MKKVILTLVLAVAAITANAQVYVGGSVSFSKTKDIDAEYAILPEIGYNISDNMAIGTIIGYASSDWTFALNKVFEIDPYIRYTFAEIGDVRLFCDARFALSFGKEFYTDDNKTVWGLGIAPGLAIPVSDHLSFVGHCGFLGYANDTFMLSVHPNDFSVGVYYAF